MKQNLILLLDAVLCINSFYFILIQVKILNLSVIEN
jgi:hypothetical protein